jgi:Domain of unknown function (DUF6895)
VDSAALLGSGEGALDWIARNKAAFDPLPRDAGRPYELRIKALGELALLCRALAPHGRYARYVEPAVDLIVATWERPEYGEWLLHRPVLLPLYLATYETLRSRRDAQPEFAMIQAILADAYPFSSEQWPFQHLELRFRLDSLGLPHHLPSYDALYRETALSKHLSTSLVSDSDCYSITHTIFYLMDPLFPHPSAIPDGDLPEIRALVGELLGLCVLEGNWDLVLELLICAAYLGEIPRDLIHAGTAALVEAQLADGRIPASQHPEARHNTDAGNWSESFSSDYHPTLLWAEATVTLWASGTAS